MAAPAWATEGLKLHRLTLERPTGRVKGKCSVWQMRCECGRVVEAVPRRDVKSCGCAHRDTWGAHLPPPKHGYWQHPKLHRLYRTLFNMRYRCGNPNSKDWENYGGRGISVCAEWEGPDGPVKFVQWSLANGWEQGLQIDRIDNNAGYSPENCRWVTSKVSNSNRRKPKSRRGYNDLSYRLSA